MLKKLWNALFSRGGPQWVRAELRYVSYATAEKMLAENTADVMWRVAREEDHNRVIGMVYLELAVKVPGHARV